MKKLFLFLLLASCAMFSPAKKLVISEEIKAWKVSKVEMFPGNVKLLQMPLSWDGDIQILCGEREIPYFNQGEYLKFYLSESYFSSRHPYSCSLNLKDGDRLIYSQKIYDIEIRSYKFPRERLHVDKKRLWLSPEDLKRVEQEKIILQQVYQQRFADRVFFTDGFISPLNSKVTSVYGARRIYNNKKEGQHLGIDFRAPVGEPIPVANSGRVVYAGDLFFSGKSVIVAHGLDIFSVYSHLSEIKTVEGEYVPRGAIVGLAGQTGRVSGPHLHWGVKMYGEWVNGFALIEEGF